MQECIEKSKTFCVENCKIVIGEKTAFSHRQNGFL